jgi:hypothetical protein
MMLGWEGMIVSPFGLWLDKQLFQAGVVRAGCLLILAAILGNKTRHFFGVLQIDPPVFIV